MTIAKHTGAECISRFSSTPLPPSLPWIFILGRGFYTPAKCTLSDEASWDSRLRYCAQLQYESTNQSLTRSINQWTTQSTVLLFCCISFGTAEREKAQRKNRICSKKYLIFSAHSLTEQCLTQMWANSLLRTDSIKYALIIIVCQILLFLDKKSVLVHFVLAINDDINLLHIKGKINLADILFFLFYQRTLFSCFLRSFGSCFTTILMYFACKEPLYFIYAFYCGTIMSVNNTYEDQEDSENKLTLSYRSNTSFM